MGHESNRDAVQTGGGANLPLLLRKRRQKPIMIADGL
jgi:hypothetical protein